MRKYGVVLLGVALAGIVFLAALPVQPVQIGYSHGDSGAALAFDATPVPAATSVAGDAPYKNPDLPVEQRVEDLLARMTLDEKIGQMTQVELSSIRPGDITAMYIGSILSGGGQYPNPNKPETWLAMINGLQQYALNTRLGIPIIYGVDAVHGHNNLYGATIFPHEVGLGAANDPELMKRIGQATAEEMVATGVYWNFAPVVAVVQDIRWGRTYEAYGENTDLVTRLAVPYILGLQGDTLGSGPLSVLATPKHYIGDGGTAWGTSDSYLLDRGVSEVDEATLRALFLPPYKAAVDAGALSIMPSFSSWGGLKMHAQTYLLTDVLKGELGFKGFLISDWQAVDLINPNYYISVVTAITAGIDMVMVPSDYPRFIETLKAGVTQGTVPMARIDDAVRRILRAKFTLGVFEHPLASDSLLPQVGSAEHRALAREAVGKSLVLLKNDGDLLPLAKDTPVIFVGGQAANDMGIQSGGWTLEWQGTIGGGEPGTTILQGIQAAAAPGTQVIYDATGSFSAAKDSAGNPLVADVGIAVVGERPYAEGFGDTATLTVSLDDLPVLDALRARCHKLIVVLVTGRPLIVTDRIDDWDALVVAWLPGTEGQGVADGLFGDRPFTGKLPYTWPRSVKQLPFDFKDLGTGENGPLFPYGFGLE